MQSNGNQIHILTTILFLSIGSTTVHAELAGRRPFIDSRNPPYFQVLDPAKQAQVDLGHAVFNTQWVPAGTAGAARRDGLGPLFNAAACDACHNEGAHGRGPSGDGETPVALVMELAAAPGTTGRVQTGDPRYGRNLNTAALQGLKPEATVRIHYRDVAGRYPDGAVWSLRDPQYTVSELQYGPLSGRTILQPRLAPALFGVGLLEAVPDGPTKRFGWQGTSASIRDQTTKAFARDMGLTSSDVGEDDCTAAQRLCRSLANGGTPEVSEELLTAVIEFQRYLAVPVAASVPPDAAAMQATFSEVGCDACHRQRLPVTLTDATGRVRSGEIDPYTDLRLHDLGSGLSDRTVMGKRVESKWRTAPLWGMNYRLQRETTPTFLHDGRARSIEEAVLWHAGEAETARQHFEMLPAVRRQWLLAWLATL